MTYRADSILPAKNATVVRLNVSNQAKRAALHSRRPNRSTIQARYRCGQYSFTIRFAAQTDLALNARAAFFGPHVMLGSPIRRPRAMGIILHDIIGAARELLACC